MCLAQGHNAVLSVRLEPQTSISSQALYHPGEHLQFSNKIFTVTTAKIRPFDKGTFV